ncbi:uncharacterized protein AB675_2385 [Cyphellophora attinorum]|uniref:Heterokaryon incompatibility domain-containing protein n=1 Tax=Cyphellophora attinorum TaxID=1664694 RepID=A0A0N1P1G7_9EURO|nr:uncharacterized protein AB675_2385 [Phialophora attinorum]KPI44852.1 hypothetical protein AB675_2385 [Phialophora attinorum]
MGFPYLRLKSDEIRLLKPLTRPPEPLSFEIVHVPLPSRPHYVALSYTWGPPDNRHQISLNGRRFSIRTNLNDALQQIQSSKLVSDYLWVDAICINQGEDSDASRERSFQITRMKQLYEQAAKVLVWLGNAINESNNRLAFETLSYFRKLRLADMKKASPYRPWWWPRKYRTNGQYIAHFVQTVTTKSDRRIFDVPGSRTHSAWLGIVALWKSSWWTRTWVFQEATVPEPWVAIAIRPGPAFMPPCKVKFLCSDQQTDWLELTTAYIIAAGISSTPGMEAGFLTGAAEEALKLMIFRELRIQEATGSFLEVLDMLRHSDCADARDKVYAPMYLAPDDVRGYIRPDYEGQTVLDVYLSVVRYCGGSDCENASGVESILPSWVPNFSSSTKQNPIPKYLWAPENVPERAVAFLDRRGLPNYKLSHLPSFCALDAELPASKKPQIRGNDTLLVSGVYVDVLKDIIPDSRPDLEAAKAVARVKGREWAMGMHNQYATTGETYLDALKRTLALDIVYDDNGRPSERGGKVENEFLQRPRAELSMTEYRYQLNMKAARAKAFAQRDLGLSKDNYLLVIPNTASVGDAIWALSGGRVLYCLRPVDGGEVHQYRIIGECYAHGLMDGEISRRVRMGEAHFRDLCIV